jgi:hypothetical protein
MEIEKTAAEPDALRYLRGRLFVQERYRQRGVDVAALMSNALDVLTPLAEEGTDLYNHKALATIGMLHLGEGDCANALEGIAALRLFIPRFGLALDCSAARWTV